MRMNHSEWFSGPFDTHFLREPVNEGEEEDEMEGEEEEVSTAEHEALLINGWRPVNAQENDDLLNYDDKERNSLLNSAFA